MIAAEVTVITKSYRMSHTLDEVVFHDGVDIITAVSSALIVC